MEIQLLLQKIKQKTIPFILFSFFTLGCNSLYYHPSKRIYITPDRFKKAYHEKILTTKSGKNLYTWLITKPTNNHNNKNKDKNLVLQFHGNAQNMTAHMTSLIWLTDYDYDLLTFDYRGYGKSEGNPTPLGLREDSLKFLEYAYQIFKKNDYKRLIIIGQSLGGVVAMDALTYFPKRNDIDLLVLDSTFSSYKHVGMKVLQKSWVTFLLSPLSYILVSNQTSPIDKLHLLTMPKIIIHAKQDPIVDFSEGKDLFDNLPESKKLWSFDEKTHINSFLYQRGIYKKKFLNFVQSLPTRNISNKDLL